MQSPFNEHKTHKRKNFTHDEDEKLRKLVGQYGEDNWRIISSCMPSRNVRQCRERWLKYSSPNVCTSKWTQEEDYLLIQKRQELGPKWKDIAAFFHGRTDINIKSRFNVLKRRAIRIHAIVNIMQNSFETRPKKYRKKKNIAPVQPIIDDNVNELQTNATQFPIDDFDFPFDDYDQFDVFIE